MTINDPFSNSHEQLVTFENTVKVGNTIMVDGVQCKIKSVEHVLKGRSDGGYWEIKFENHPSTSVGLGEAEDWYILYQNGKK